MCIVVDPPLFIPMFKTSDPEHTNFSPVLSWVKSGRGKFVMGGTKYSDELKKVKSILTVLTELEKRGKIIRADDKKVDEAVQVVKKIKPTADFDDPHLVAIVRVTLCKLICVRDPRSHRFLRDPLLYSQTTHRPSLYTRPKNQSLLCDGKLASCCSDKK